MIIQQQDIQLDSSHSLIKHHEKTERLEAWRGENRVEFLRHNESTDVQLSGNIQRPQDAGSRGVAVPPDLLEISRQAMARSMDPATREPTVKTLYEPKVMEDDDMNLPPKLQMMKTLLKKFFGIDVKIIDPTRENNTSDVHPDATSQREQPQGGELQGWGMHYSYHELNYEKERVAFSAAGNITTADGREIDFNVELEMSKETIEQLNIDIRAGDALIDPLAINFDGKGVRLTEEKHQLDLDLDGEKENISFLEQGSGFLALDKNGNGIVDDGSELFGPSTNHGFLELKAYDNDGNDWIDEKDGIFYQLNVWTKDHTGTDRLASLQSYDIGAIYLNSTHTQFDLGEGQLRETGIYLKENGQANLIQEVDLMV
ncbi:MAG: hypothetical protein GY940_37800 [bacterium]|nr:hypothetical protein [bacterium]